VIVLIVGKGDDDFGYLVNAKARERTININQVQVGAENHQVQVGAEIKTVFHMLWPLPKRLSQTVTTYLVALTISYILVRIHDPTKCPCLVNVFLLISTNTGHKRSEHKKINHEAPERSSNDSCYLAAGHAMGKGRSWKRRITPKVPVEARRLTVLIVSL
jgi:hypothetical protein